MLLSQWSSATGAATAGSGGGGSLDTDSTDKSASAGSHKLHQMRDDSGYKSLETQQSLGKSGNANASLLARIGTRSMDRTAPGLLPQPPAAAVVGRAQYSLEAPSLPVKFAATSPKLKDILVPVPQLPVQDAKTTHHVDESATNSKTSSHSVTGSVRPETVLMTTASPSIEARASKTSSHSTLTEFLAGISSGSSQPTTDDPTQRKQHIPFVPEAAFLEKFAERTQTVGRALTSSFDRIRQQAGSFLSRTTAVVRGSSDVETPVTHPVSAPFRRASSSECQSTWTEKDSRLAAIPDPYHRRSNSGEVFTKDDRSPSTRVMDPDNMHVRYDGQSLHPGTVRPMSSRSSSFSDPTRDTTTSTSFASAIGSKFVGPETSPATTATPSMTSQSSRTETRDACKEIQPGIHQLMATDTARGSAHRQDRSSHGTNPVSPSVVQASSSAHPVWTHAKQSHFVAGETAASTADFGRGNKKTASKRRRDYRSKKQVQEVHHSGSLTETTPHHPEPPVHAYSAVVGEPSSSDNSLEQPSTTSGGGSGGSGASDASSSCEVVSELRQTRGLSRDYSIDAKTDALFHEFVKYDPNLSGGQFRWKQSTFC